MARLRILLYGIDSDTIPGVDWSASSGRCGKIPTTSLSRIAYVCRTYFGEPRQKGAIASRCTVRLGQRSAHQYQNGDRGKAEALSGKAGPLAKR